MDSPFSTLGFVIFGITFSIYSGIAKSQPPSPSVSRPSPPPLPPPPSYLVPPPPPHTPPRSPPLRPPHSLSPPRSRHSSPPPNLALKGPEPKPNSKSPPLRPPHSLSPPRSRHSSPPPNLALKGPGPKPNSKRPPYHRSPPRPPSPRMNVGKKIGLLFAGIAGIMQIGVVGFLVFKRRQLLRMKDAFEASA
ncbi:hypothetical protein QN277_024031 [Acacia crassicarpa]|uniref:Uncharacterized protein n=1 Tax=Acacia crassicarpa TaxID=499986 RepID=A0AAE1MJP9_9FABA|nr:hypothetical protein QN277_024031 [Acacia crassicarpa]